MGRGLGCSLELHAPCRLRMLCALLLCSGAMPSLQVEVGHARRAVSAFNHPFRSLASAWVDRVLTWAAWVWCTLCTWAVTAVSPAAPWRRRLTAGALHRVLWAGKAVCPGAARPACAQESPQQCRPGWGSPRQGSEGDHHVGCAAESVHAVNSRSFWVL